MIRTTTECPVSMAVTCTDVPNGRLRCAATRSCDEVRPLEDPRYQDAMTTWLHDTVPSFGARLGPGADACCGCCPAQPARARSRRDDVKLARTACIAPRFAGRTMARLWHDPRPPQNWPLCVARVRGVIAECALP